MFIVYDIIFILLTFLYMPVLFFKRKWHNGFYKRFGFLSKSDVSRLTSKKNIWIHAVSVGEVMAVESLIKRIAEDLSEYQIVISTTTQTGQKIAQSKFGNSHVVVYSPLDFSWVVRKYIKIINPAVYICAETELWPNLFAFLSKNEKPIILVNGRISDKSFQRYKKIYFLVRSILRKIKTICVQTQEDANRLENLGAEHHQIVLTGNMKFDNVQTDDSISRDHFSYMPDEIVILAGSTHPGEEEIVVEVFKQLKVQIKNLRLIMVPRHIERSVQIESYLNEQQMSVVRFSAIQSGSKTTQDDIILVDTIGHLRGLYPLTDVIFIGKSLCGGGGQNVIEPAFCAKPIIVGPLTYNFRDVVSLLKSKEAILEVVDKQEMYVQLKRLCENREVRIAMGGNAKSVVESMQGATQKTFEQVSLILKS